MSRAANSFLLGPEAIEGHRRIRPAGARSPRLSRRWTCIGWVGLALLLPPLQTGGLAQCVQNTDVTGSIQYPMFPPAWNVRLVYDQAHGIVLALDDCTGVVYRYDGRAWADILPPPHEDLPPCSSRGAWVYDSVQGNCLLLLGSEVYTGQPGQGLYSYVSDGQGWKKLSSTGAAPAPAYAAVGAFDPGRGRAIFLVHSAPNDAYTWETWEWTGSGWDAGPVLGNVNPDSFTFDEARGVGFLSGQDPASSLEAVRLYTPGATAAAGRWSRVALGGSPYDGRIGAPLVYDPIRDRIIRCMGKYEGNLFGYVPDIDVWDWASSSWNHADSSNDLPYADRRASVGAAYDLNRDVMVLYGGYTYAEVNGTGVQSERTDTWEQRVLDVLYVNSGATGSQDGSAAHPFATVRQAAAGITSCIRAISIQPGIYQDSPLTLRTPVILQAPNGAARIQ